LIAQSNKFTKKDSTPLFEMQAAVGGKQWNFNQKSGENAPQISEELQRRFGLGILL